MEIIRILFAHPSRLVVDSLRDALDDVEEVYVVGCATTKEELHFLLPHSNVILLATELKDASAVELLPEIRMTKSDVKVLVFGLSEKPQAVISYIEAGASGYILQRDISYRVSQWRTCSKRSVLRVRRRRLSPLP
jgi:DNA-binding NarL/FixJ family response regulator